VGKNPDLTMNGIERDENKFRFPYNIALATYIDEIED
jgi:hypothetical protein